MRLEGWEGRLDAVIDAARHEAYELGRHDCFRFACQVVHALIGVDRWPEFAGYRTHREALAKIAAYGSSFEAAGDWFFGVGRSTARLARRGDIVALRTKDGMKHLGICIGERVAVLAEEGLTFLPLTEDPQAPVTMICSWRID